MKRLFFCLLAVCAFANVSAQVETTDISSYDNVIYYQNAECTEGDATVTLKVNVRAYTDFRGFQFDAYFPEGAVYQSNSINSNRYSSSNLMPGGNLRDEGFYRYMAFFFSTTDKFTGGDDLMVSFDVDVSNLTAGEYPLIIRGATVTIKTTEAYNIKTDIVSKLVVKEKVPTTDVSVLDDVAYVKNMEFPYGTGVVDIPVCAKYHEDFQSLQVDLLFPDGVTLQTTSDGEYLQVTPNEARFATVPMNLLMANLRTDGTARIVAASLMPYTRFTGSDSEFCYLSVDLSGLEPGVYPVIVKSAVFSGFASDPVGTSGEVTVSDEIISKIVITKLVGDITRDGLVNVQDVTALVNIIQQRDKEEYNYDYDAADVNNDGTYNVIDVTALVNIIQGRTAQ